MEGASLRTVGWQALAGGVIVLLLTGVTLSPGARASALSMQRLVLVSGPSPFSPSCAPAFPGETNYFNAEVEPRVAVDPLNAKHIVGVWQQDRWAFGGALGLLAGVSWDGGKTWTRSMAAFDRCAGGTTDNGGDYERASDPWVTFAANGDVYQISISFDATRATNSVLVSKSTDGGEQWSNPTTLIVDNGFTFFNDKESITGDPHDAQSVYAVWDRSFFPPAGFRDKAFRGPIMFSRTTDGGQTWEKARAIYDPGRVASTISNQVAVLPNGDLLDMFARFFPNGALEVDVIRSTDRGVTWSAPVTVGQLQTVSVFDPDTGAPIRTGDIVPDINVDPQSGKVYVVWQDGRFSEFAHDDIVLSVSSDGGLTWSAPIKINQTPISVPAFTASVSVASDGTVAVTYYDFRGNTPDPNTLFTDYWIVTCRSSCDDAASWSSETHIAGPFDMLTAPFAGGFFVGDYEGLAAVGKGFLAFFVQANSGDLNNPTDVFAAKVA